MLMYGALKISHHSHSGRFRSHENTSYLPLMILLLIVGIVLSISTVTAQSPGPEARSVGLTGTMPGEAPTTGAIILTPNDQDRFTTSPITVSGTCPAGTLVEIFKNEIFAGSGACSDDGTFSLLVDLLIGQNILIARVYDALNQAGPDSEPVTVHYDALPFQGSAFSPLNFGGAQLVLNTDAVYRGSFPEQELNVPIIVLGGTPPYAVSIEWGDANNKIVPRNDNIQFNVTHAYNKPGIFQISLKATDSRERVAFLTVAAIINGQPAVVSSITPSAQTLNKLLAIWPVYTTSIVMLISFWLGERREKKILLNLGVPDKVKA